MREREAVAGPNPEGGTQPVNSWPNPITYDRTYKATDDST